MAQDRVPPVADRISALTEVARTLQDAGIGVQDIGLRRPTLDEVLLHLTGRPAVSETLTAATSGTVPPHDTLCVNLCWLGWPWSGLRWPLVRPGPPRVKDAVRPWGAGFAGP